MATGERESSGSSDSSGSRSRPDGSSGSFKTLDDSIEEHERAQTMAELKAALERERQTAAAEGAELPEPPRNARPRARDDELLDEFPDTDYHLGRFAGWRAARKIRWFVGLPLGIAVVIGVVLFVLQRREMKHARLHPLPAVEATIAPGTPREMTYADGKFRVAISREAPAVNLVHLPDRDITLARGADKAQFKVEIRDGKTVKLKVLTGKIVETLTRDDAEPLLTGK
jgi:hypothetical protein